MLKKTVGNWVDGDRFFDREDDLAALQGFVRDGTHTLLTGQRRLGKTSLVRELIRRLSLDGEIKTAFIDLEDARDAADAIAAMTLETTPILSRARRWSIRRDKLLERFLAVDMKADYNDAWIKVRAKVNRGNWKKRGDRLMADLAAQESQVLLVIDELPLLITRLLREDGNRDRAKRVSAADEFLSWLRKVAQRHRGRICVIVSGSIGIVRS